MKHATEQDGVVQDLSVAHQLATLLISPQEGNKAAIARRLAYEVLGFDSSGRYSDAPLTSINEAIRLIPWDEPVFLLRAQDPFAVARVKAWLEEAVAAGIDRRLIDLVRRHIKLMNDWPIRKTPEFVLPKNVLPKRL